MSKKSSAIVVRILMWLAWCFSAVQLVFDRTFLVGSSHRTHAVAQSWSPSSLALYLVPIVLALSMRWWVIPRLRNPLMGLIALVFGLSFGNALAFFGIFIVPQHFDLFFWTSLLLLLQFAPLWREKVEQADAPNRHPALQS